LTFSSGRCDLAYKGLKQGAIRWTDACGFRLSSELFYSAGRKRVR